MVGMQIRLLIEPCKIAMVHTLLCFVDLIVAAVLPNFVLNGFFRFFFNSHKGATILYISMNHSRSFICFLTKVYFEDRLINPVKRRQEKRRAEM